MAETISAFKPETFKKTVQRLDNQIEIYYGPGVTSGAPISVHLYPVGQREIFIKVIVNHSTSKLISLVEDSCPQPIVGIPPDQQKRLVEAAEKFAALDVNDPSRELAQKSLVRNAERILSHGALGHF